MSEAQLEPQEIEALQSAMRESAPKRPAALDMTPTRLALIADDRTAEAARPVLIGLATRAIRSATRGLRPHLPTGWQLDVAGADVIDGNIAKEELRGGWVAGMRATDEAELVVVAHGSVIDHASARRCGQATPATGEAERTPSTLSLRLFQPAGRSTLEAISAAWTEVFPSKIDASSDLGIVSRLIESRSVVRVAMAFTGAVTGRIQIYARPEGLIPRPSALAAFRATAQRIASALSHVPVEVVVELGNLRMRLSELRKLDAGATFTLSSFVDSQVPVYCEGVLKAWARPVVCRGVLAVEIVSIVHGQGGNKS